MIKLFYSAGSCSMCCQIAAEEAGLPYDGRLLDWDKPDANVAELNKLNPLGAAPVMVTEDGKLLTQNIPILEYIADKKPGSHLLAATGTFEHYETMRWLSMVATDLHKSFGPLFQLESIVSTPAAQAEVRTWSIKNIKEVLSQIDTQLAGRDYLTGKHFTVADSYLFVVLGWTKWVDVKIDEFKNVTAFANRVYQRPAVQKVLKANGMLN